MTTFNLNNSWAGVSPSSRHKNAQFIDAKSTTPFVGSRPRRLPHFSNLKVEAISSPSASPDATSSSERPPCYKEVWTPPEASRLIKDKRVFREEHRIRGYEVNPCQHASIVTIANLLQEVAGNHAVAMWGRSNEGFAADPALAELGLIFVMTRMQIQMDHYPRWGDMVEFETWFQEAGKLGAQRDWIIRDKLTGRNIGRATSTWVMININTRRLSKMPDSMRQRCSWYQMQPPANAIPSEFTRLKIPEVAIGDVSEEEPSTSTNSCGNQNSTFVARRCDMDMNGHINNAVYFAWGVETVPSDVYDNCHLYQMEVDFKAECLCGDVIQAYGRPVETSEEMLKNGAGPDALTFAHTLQRRKDDKVTELVRARTIWRVGSVDEE